MNLIVPEARNGLGAFLTAPAKKDDIIVDWSNHPLFQQPPRIPKGWKFAFVPPGMLRGPLGPEEHPDAYINHSCEPNAELILARPRIHLIAKRPIDPGEEVTFDYATLYSRAWSMKCECRSTNCRGLIRGMNQV